MSAPRISYEKYVEVERDVETALREVLDRHFPPQEGADTGWSASVQLLLHLDPEVNHINIELIL